MRKLVLAIILCSIASTQAVAFNTSKVSTIAYEQDTKGDKYAILVQSIKNLRSSIMTGSEIKKDNPKADFQIVIMGQMVQELNNKELRAELDAADKAGVKLVVCEFALKVYGVTLNDLPLYFIGTPNAHKYMFQLNENKYNTLSI